MVSLAGILSPVPRGRAEEFPAIANKSKTKLETLIAKITEIVSPLASVSTRGELRRLLDRIAPEYLHLNNEAGRLIMDELSAGEFSQFAARASGELLNLIRADETVLGAKDQELLDDIVESLRELLQGVMDIPAESQGALTDILLECSSALQRVNLCLSAIILVLTLETRRWNPIAIKLLTRAAPEFMRQVEDVFLVHDAELVERLNIREQSVSLEEVRKELGLRS